MNQTFRKIFSSKFNNLSFVVSLVFVLGGWLWAYLALRTISLPLIIHFSNISGINQVGYAWDLAKVGLFGILVVMVNFLIAYELELRDKFLAKLASAFTLFLSILIFIYFAAIISVN
ncbi:MAG: hypothetical protein HY093_04780 [Candidatus Liptonbacteria bacterium]|nr:hypothetical protein [Candidatus Liptonbacteria bacterium]